MKLPSRAKDFSYAWMKVKNKLFKSVEIKTTQMRKTEAIYSELARARVSVLWFAFGRDSKAGRGMETLYREEEK